MITFWSCHVFLLTIIIMALTFLSFYKGLNLLEIWGIIKHRLNWLLDPYVQKLFMQLLKIHVSPFFVLISKVLARSLFTIIQLFRVVIVLVKDNCTVEYIRKETKNTNSNRHTHPNVHTSIVYNSQVIKATQLSINRWIKKMLYIYAAE